MNISELHGAGLKARDVCIYPTVRDRRYKDEFPLRRFQLNPNLAQIATARRDKINASGAPP